MPAESYNVIGAMSGTSLDGIDLAHLRLENHHGNWRYELHECQTIPYHEQWISRLRRAVGFNQQQLTELDREYTQLLAGAINDFTAAHGIKNLDAVCSHGHTVLHRPDLGYTLQIGNLPEIAQLLGKKVVCDFRTADVKLGGQGAPLVPIGDRMLFSDYDYCLNLGGFSNISFEESGQRIAFDISPVNTVLNFYANRFGFEYDDGGQIARSGVIDEALLARLDALPYYRQPYPKSLGFEFVRDTVLPLIEGFAIPDADKLQTFTTHVAGQLSAVLPNAPQSLLVTGGGAYNSYLIELLKKRRPKLRITVADKKLLEYKEALIFGLLGVLRLRAENNVFCSVTGSKRDHCSGEIYTPDAAKQTPIFAND